MSAEEALYHKLDAHGEDDEHEEAHYPGTLHLAGESSADLTAGYEAYPREYECREPLDVADEGVSGRACGGVEREGEYGCGDRDLHGESEGIYEDRFVRRKPPPTPKKLDMKPSTKLMRTAHLSFRR